MDEIVPPLNINVPVPTELFVILPTLPDPALPIRIAPAVKVVLPE